MKRRKRMGLPKAGVICSRPMRGAARQSPPEDAVEMLRDIIEEQHLAAKQRRLLELVSAHTTSPSPREAQSKQLSEGVVTTPEKVVALLNRIAESDENRTGVENDTGRPLGD